MSIVLFVLLAIAVGLGIGYYFKKKFELQLRSLAYRNKNLVAESEQKTDRINSMRVEYGNLKGKADFTSIRLAAVENELEKNKLAFHKFKKEEVPKIRKEAVKKSKEVNTGFASENFAMFMQDNLNPKDFRHLGDPIDFVVACGADDVRNGVADEVSEIVLLDVKTGNASLNKIQRRIRDAVVAGRVSFATLTINDDGINYRFWRQDED